MKYDLSHIRADTLILPLAFSSNSVAIDLTGSTIIFSVKENIGDSTYKVQKTATLTNAVGWLAEIKATSSEMNLPVGVYYYDIQWTDSIGTVRTFLYGAFTISYQVTT